MRDKTSKESKGEGEGHEELVDREEPAGEHAAERSDAPNEASAPAELRDRWLRAEAELQNFRRRAQRDADEAVRFAEDRLLLQTIGNLDDLERALSTAGEAGAPDPWVQGVQLVAQRMRDELARHDVTPIPALGQRFDPEQHEALMEAEAAPGVEPGHVLQVVREGYRRGGRALRAARVVVARHPEGD